MSVFIHLYIYYVCLYRFAERRGPLVVGRAEAHETAISTTLHYAPGTSTYLRSHLLRQQQIIICFAANESGASVKKRNTPAEAGLETVATV